MVVDCVPLLGNSRMRGVQSNECGCEGLLDVRASAFYLLIHWLSFWIGPNVTTR